MPLNKETKLNQVIKLGLRATEATHRIWEMEVNETIFHLIA